MSEKLKPCPFCGSEARLSKSLDKKSVYAECSNPSCPNSPETILYDTEEEAIEAWNKRPNPWHTGTPTEEGYYLVQLRGYYYKDTIGKIVAKWERNWWRTIHVGSYRNLEEDIKAWMPIELNKETD